jgi:SAM-dependent methyltransferase
MPQTQQADASKLRSGDPDYRAYVGGPGRYDVLAAAQFSFLVDAGLRDEHRVLDVGCGSLRLGRLLIPWLQDGRYFGVEPNEWLVEAGFEKELGHAIRELKHPQFRFVDDFSVAEFGVEFDYVMAYSVFTHCYPDLGGMGLAKLAGSLAPSGLLLGTFVENRAGDTEGKSKLLPHNGSGWIYPKCVRYTWDQFADLLRANGLVGFRVFRPAAHKQSWFIATRPGNEKLAQRTARATTLDASGDRPLREDARRLARRAAGLAVTRALQLRSARAPRRAAQ